MNSGGQTRFGLTPSDLLLGAALTYFLVVGGTELGGFLPFRILNAAIGAAVVAIWLLRLPQRADRTDALVLGALTLYLLACVLSAFPRVSFSAGVEAMVYAALFSLARWELARDSAARSAILVMGVAAAGIGLLIISVWGGVWRDWLLLVGTVPPLDVRLPVGPYRHAHTVAMLMALLSPALLLLLRDRKSRLIGAAGLVLALFVVLMAGSRGVWAAVAVVVAGTIVLRGPRWRRVFVWLAVGAAVIVVAAVITGLVATFIERLAATSTLSLRFAYWEETLQQWAQRPLAGWGPGSFDIVVTLGDYFDTQSYVPRHADNALIQLLGEAGLLGIGTLALIAAAIIVGVRAAGARSSAWGVAGVILFILMSATDNPSDTPNLVVVAILWAALAAPSGIAEQGAVIQRSALMRRVTVAASLVVSAAVASVLVAAAAFDQARTAEDPSAAREALETSLRFDPGMALYLRSLADVESAAGELDLAERHLVRATGLNPADATAYRSLAAVRAAGGDLAGAIQAAERAVERRRSHPENLLTLALLAAQADQRDLARDSLVAVLAYEPWLPASPSWDDGVIQADEMREALLEAGPISADLARAAPTWEFSSVWLSALTDQPVATDSATMETLSDVLRCRLTDAASRLTAGPSISTGSDVGVVTTLLLARLLDDEELWRQGAIIARLRISRLPLVPGDAEPANPLEDRAEDLRLYEMAAPDAPSGISLPSTEQAMAAWLADPVRAAEVSAPGTALAECGLP